MGLLQWLGIRRKRPLPELPEPAPPQSVLVLTQSIPEPIREPPRLSAVLVDIPNIVNAWRTPEHPYVLESDWDAILREQIREEIEGTTPILLPLAVSSMEVWSKWGEEFLERNRTTWQEAGYRFENNEEKDIDTIFAIELMDAVNKAMEAHERVHLRLILVTGDGIHSRAIRRLRETYAKRLSLELIVYGWGNRVSMQYSRLTSRNNVRYLENIPGFAKRIEQQTRR